MLSEQRQRLLSLLLWRALASSLLLLLTLWFYWPAVDALEQHNLIILGFIWMTVLLLQGLLWRYVQNYFLPQLFLQFLSDLLLIAALMFLTGGVHSPFILLFGLVIVSAGTQARVLLVLSVAVLASIAYLSTVYVYSWVQEDILPAEATLKLLLQISMFWLVGGVMALIARRHAVLMLESDHILQEHRDFKHVHSDLMASMKEGVLVLDANYKVIDCNPAFLHVLNSPDYLNKDVSLLGDFPETFMQSLLSAKKQSMRMEWQYGDATYLLTSGFFSPTQLEAYAWLTLVDITQLRALELKLAEQERLASLGRLSAMLAHEFRNPMQTIAQATELMPRLPEKTQGKVQKIVFEEVQRLNCLLTDMLDYAKPLEANITNIDVCSVVESVLKQDMFLTSKVAVHVALETIQVDERHWRRVLENLLHHALAASPAPESVGIVVHKAASDWCLEVCDHGECLSEAMRVQMFEPFGEHRGGTGLGLATVWQICKADGWILTVESEQEMTCIRVQTRMGDEVNHG